MFLWWNKRNYPLSPNTLICSTAYELMFSDRQIWTNSADQDQTEGGAVWSGPHCLPFCLHLLYTFLYGKNKLFKFPYSYNMFRMSECFEFFTVNWLTKVSEVSGSSPGPSRAFLKESSKGFLLSSWNRPSSSQFLRNFVGVGVWSETRQEMRLVTRKHIFGVCNQDRHKPACTATEAR